MKPKIAFTGGHHSSALVIAKALKKEGYPIIWFGHKFTSRGDKSFSAEYQEVVKEGIQFLELKTGKFYRSKNPLEYIKIILGFFQALVYLINNRPKLIFASGGYLSVPIVITGWMLGIPSITHEQTVVAGWANRAIAPFVKKILLTHESSRKNYPKSKIKVVGLPLREEILDKKLKKKYTPPLIYISCGKQGSHLINQAVFPIIPELVKKYTVYHQTGANTLVKDTDRARRIKDSLGDNKKRYHFAPYFFSKDAATCLHSASIVISRAGAHAVYELSYLQKKTIFIPISWVSHNEQELNANLAKRYTACITLAEDDLSPESLQKAIDEVKNIKTPTNPPKLITDATNQVINIVHQYLDA